MAHSSVIDVWDVSTFDDNLMKLLAAETDLVHDYMSTEHKIFLSYEFGRGSGRGLMRPSNPYAFGFMALKEAIANLMEQRAIRAWHYSRLTDTEVADMQSDGMHLSTPETLRKRLDALVMAGELSREIADALFRESPFHSEQLESRSGKFWMTSHPAAIDYSGVEPLLAHWGGEVASMRTKDPALLTPLAAIGKPRVIELAVPLSMTRQHELAAGEAVIATFGRAMGCIPSKSAFDLYVKAPLGGDAVLAIHTEGDTAFTAIGRGYPTGYIDVDIGRWKELTGEED